MANDSVVQHDTFNAKAIYVMFMAGVGWLPVAIGAVVWAYTARDTTDSEFLQYHYENQIKLFWTAFWVGLLGMLLLIVIVGLFILIGLWIWFIIQCRDGLILLNKGEWLTEE